MRRDTITPGAGGAGPDGFPIVIPNVAAVVGSEITVIVSDILTVPLATFSCVVEFAASEMLVLDTVTAPRSASSSSIGYC